MSNENPMIGRSVVLYLDGGWQLSGEISIIKDDRIFLKNNNDVFMVFKNKISAMHMNSESNMNDVDNGSRIPVSTVGSKNTSNELDMLRGEGYEQGPSIPFDMLTRDAQDASYEDDYSVFFGGTQASDDDNRSGITFSLDGGNDDT